MSIRIQTEDFDLSVELNRLRSDHRDIGAVVSFVGTVRDVNDDDGVLSHVAYRSFYRSQPGAAPESNMATGELSFPCNRSF